MAKFEKVSRFADVDLAMPVRKTANSAGYDLVVAQDIVIPSYKNLIGKISPCINSRTGINDDRLIFEINCEISKVIMAMEFLIMSGFDFNGKTFRTENSKAVFEQGNRLNLTIVIL